MQPHLAGEPVDVETLCARHIRAESSQDALDCRRARRRAQQVSAQLGNVKRFQSGWVVVALCRSVCQCDAMTSSNEVAR